VSVVDSAVVLAVVWVADLAVVYRPFVYFYVVFFILGFEKISISM